MSTSSEIVIKQGRAINSSLLLLTRTRTSATTQQRKKKKLMKKKKKLVKSVGCEPRIRVVGFLTG